MISNRIIELMKFSNRLKQTLSITDNKFDIGIIKVNLIFDEFL